MFRYLILFSWIVFFVLLIFRFKGHLISEPVKENLERVLLKRQLDAIPLPQTKDESRETILEIVRLWDFEKFHGIVHPELRQQIPREGLRELFRGIAKSLGDLETVRGSRTIEGSRGITKSLTVKVEGAFSKGSGLIEAEFLETGKGWMLLQFAVDSPEIRPVSEAAEEAVRKGFFDASSFRRSLAANR